MTKNPTFWQYFGAILADLAQISKKTLSPGFVSEKRPQKHDFETKNRGFFNGKVQKLVF